jgi:ubiquinone/menaquinone biosynthesis C-methylase UbiE
MTNIPAVPESHKGSGGFKGRTAVAQHWFNMLTRKAQLQPDDSVLDVGCGLGRMAVALMPYLTGRYEGFDVDGKAIQWCRDNITPKAPNFRFQAFSVHNNVYNPKGNVDSDTFRFPYDDGAFDVAFLASVFTHMLPRSVTRYVEELQRVLKSGGRCVASYFLLNEASEQAITERRMIANRDFPVSMDGCRVQYAHAPERAVAHHETKIRELYERNGFRITAVFYGGWSGHARPRGGQDKVFAIKL